MSKFKKFSIIGASLAIFFIAGSAISQNIKFNPIKPGAKSSAQMTDEQQAVLAVRAAKASVVSIVGRGSKNSPQSGFSLTSPLLEEVSGTGFVIDKDGLIVTNNHVVSEKGFEYFVILADGESFKAEVTGNDPIDDIALLKIDAPGLSPVRLGDSDALETGQSVFAIGNSLGKYQNSVTRGVISGLGRSVDENLAGRNLVQHNWIQTDAAISLGNSGGPLINLAGEVVGMNTLIDVGGSALGFAVPINAIKDAVHQLKTFGKVSRPFMGIQFLPIDARLQLERGLPVKDGALVVSAAKGSAAEQAGILAGDIIVSVDGKALNQQNPLNAVIQKYQAGNQVMLKILRGGQNLELPLVLGQFQVSN